MPRRPQAPQTVPPLPSGAVTESFGGSSAPWKSLIAMMPTVTGAALATSGGRCRRVSVPSS